MGDSERGEGEIGAIVTVVLLAWGAIYAYQWLTAPPNATETDRIYSQQRFNRQPYTSSETIQACSETGNCYSVVATIHHEFDGDGTEHKTVEQLNFDNGGHLDLGGAPLPGLGTDQRGRSWSLSQ